ncbi:MAG: RNA methyltransferase [Neisseria sp.]|nr:RNA methyltransferase [Neisseria sp.]
MTTALLPEFLQRIRVVLCRTAHPANIGSAARAMKTMGLTRLVLVAPELIHTPMTPRPPTFDPAHAQDFRLPEESFILASGAADVLENARVVATLNQALHDTTLSCALTSRRRELSVPPATPRELAPELLQAASAGQEVALVFGNESYGLSIEESTLCNRLITINGNPDYFSLNLAQAVQVVTYELFSHVDLPLDRLRSTAQPVPRQEIDGLIGHFENVMDDIGFFERRNRERLLRRLRRLFDRADTEREEIDILRGFLKTVQKNTNPR